LSEKYKVAIVDGQEFCINNRIWV